ncbi:MAG: cupin, partial [Actinomycetota bacterium]|nr:cupin [Actinomycetota bacterium]
HEDGSHAELVAGDAYRISPGHDAWVVGDEPAVLMEFKSAQSYAAE